MRILIDIGHPAHVHYFRHYMRIMEGKGHQFLVISRDKEITITLLEKYGIPFFNRGKGGSSLWGKLGYILKADLFIWKKARKFKPDLFLSFASTYAAHASWLCRKPHIALDDTEHAKLELLLYPPFTQVIFTPSSFKKDLGKKQIRFNSYMELASLHPNYFEANPSIYAELGIPEGTPYAIVRFISWNASHDVGQSGISADAKVKFITELSSHLKVFISSEGTLPQSLSAFQITISPEKIHDALAFATIYIGEGATTATECAVLGVPNVLINSLAKTIGSLQLLKDHYELQYFFDDIDSARETILALLSNPETKSRFLRNRQKLLNETIDITAMLVWFTENYPESFKQLKEDPNLLNRFK